MTRVLVTGATGLIGRQLLPQLAAAGYDVHALLNRREVPPELRSLARWHSADLANASLIDATLEAARPSLLFHLAWPALAGNLDDTEVHSRFLAASQDLVRRFYGNYGERVVVAGTCFEYDWSEGVCREDHTPTSPTTVYGACKNALRLFLEETAAANHRSWAWGRIFFVYGPHQEQTRFVPAIIRALIANEPVRCTAGTQIRDYLHASDVASALLHLATSGHRGVCNIGSGQRTSLRDIASEIAAILGGDHLLQFGAKPMPAAEPPVILADTHRLIRELSWSPRFTLAEGLAHTIASYRAAERAPALV